MSLFFNFITKENLPITYDILKFMESKKKNDNIKSITISMTGNNHGTIIIEVISSVSATISFNSVNDADNQLSRYLCRTFFEGRCVLKKLITENVHETENVCIYE